MNHRYCLPLGKSDLTQMLDGGGAVRLASGGEYVDLRSHLLLGSGGRKRRAFDPVQISLQFTPPML